MNFVPTTPFKRDPHNLDGQRRAVKAALDDTARLETLALTGMLDSAPEVVFDRLTALARRLLDTPVSLVSLVDDHRQFFKAQCGLGAPLNELRETPLSHSFCRHVVETTVPLIVPDARLDERLKDNLAIRDMNVIAYLGIPIIAPDGHVIGSFCAIDNKPRQWTEADVENMSDLAIAVQSEIALRLAIEQSERDAETQELLIGELNHRVKNLFAIVTGMIGLSAREALSPKAMGETLTGRVKALARAHNLVRPVLNEDSKDEAAGGLTALIQAILAPHDVAGEITLDGEELPLSSDAAVALSMVLHEMATNMVKYGAFSEAGGRLSIRWAVDPDLSSQTDQKQLHLVWDEYRSDLDLFEPDQALKGFGDKLVQGSVRGQLGGKLNTEWRPTGLKNTLTIPVAKLLPPVTLIAA